MRPPAQRLTRKLLFTIGLGFALSLLLMAGISIIGLHELASADALLKQAVSENATKERFVSSMRDLLRSRSNSLLRIVVITDPIDRNDELERFYRIGETYRFTRQRLEKQPLSASEKAVLADIDRLTGEICPVENRIVEQGIKGNTSAALAALQQDGIQSQKALNKAIRHLLDIQQVAIDDANRQAQSAYNRTRWLMAILGSASILLAILVALFVLRRVARLSRKVERERTRFRTLFKNNSDGILILDGQRFVQCNQAMLDMLRIPTEAECLRLGIDHLDASETADGSGNSLARHIQWAYQTGHDTFEYTCRRADRSMFQAHFDMHVMLLDDRPHIQCVVRDISKQKAIEAELKAAHAEALSAVELKSQFVANVSHEIRTPLNGIVGMTKLLLEMNLDPQQKEYIETVDISTRSLMRIINDLLDFSKIEAGRLTLEEHAFNLLELLSEIVAINRPRALGKGIALAFEVSDQLPAWVSGDSLRLGQILLNLLDNAIKFTETGEVRLKVFGPVDATSDAYRFLVEDTGIGISADALPHIFEAFSQASGAISRQYGGTGLGLAICRQLCNLMGGTLSVTSRPGQGSAFELLVPLRESACPIQPSAKSATSPNERLLRQKRILVAEDNPINQKLISYMLRNHGLTVSIADDGKKAFDAIQAQDYDLVIMDCQMPQWDGLKASKEIRRWERETGRSRLPIIALTANAMHGYNQICNEAGMDDYLIKPIDESTLLDCLKKWLSVPSPSPSIEAAPVDRRQPTGGFDLDKVVQACRNDLNLIREMLSLFCSTTEDQLSRLGAAVRQGDLQTIKREAHQIKGGAAYLGARGMVRLSSAIEELAKAEAGPGTIEAQMKELSAEFIELKREIELSQAAQAG